MKKIFIVTCLFGLIFLLFRNNFISQEEKLRRNSIGLNNAKNNKDWGKVFDSLSEIENQGKNKKDYINERLESDQKRNIVKREEIIHKITINGNEGFVDRTLKICKDENCNDSQSARAYEKWILENKKWKLTSESPWCIRKYGYDKPQELERANNLVFQKYFSKLNNSKETDFSKCVDIQYKNIESEGMFIFDEKISSPEKIVIYINESYKDYDDLLRALLLSHELTHAIQFLNNGLENKNCIGKEIEANKSELGFLWSLNDEEKKSIAGRMPLSLDGISYLNNPLRNVWDIVLISKNARQKCGISTNDFSFNSPKFDCYNKQIDNQLNTLMTNNPYYQKQCGLN